MALRHDDLGWKPAVPRESFRVQKIPSRWVTIYAHDSSGNVAPLPVLATKLDQPFGIYEGA